jgi:hypothetical protein
MTCRRIPGSPARRHVPGPGGPEPGRWPRPHGPNRCTAGPSRTGRPRHRRGMQSHHQPPAPASLAAVPAAPLRPPGGQRPPATLLRAASTGRWPCCACGWTCSAYDGPAERGSPHHGWCPAPVAAEGITTAAGQGARPREWQTANPRSHRPRRLGAGTGRPEHPLSAASAPGSVLQSGDQAITRPTACASIQGRVRRRVPPPVR